jgi:phosphoesterase RecJ-like protein
MSTTAHVSGRIHETIRRANRVLLIAHKKPDGDTLGASSSVLNWLLREGKDVRIFCADLPAPNFRYIDNVHHYTTDPNIFDLPYDAVIVFDSGDLAYCGVADHIPRLPAGYTLINIDHHVTNVRFGHINLVNTDASSTAEIVHGFFEDNNIFIDPPMATSLLTGLITDTLNFSNAATNPRAVDAASKLLGYGARLNDIQKFILNDKTIPALRIWGLLLSRLRYNATYDVVNTYLLEKDTTGIPGEVIEGAANFLNAVTGNTDTIMVIREIPGGMIKGSLRSVRRDISKVAKLLGGGGHKKAAGFTIKGKIEETANGPKII